MKIYEPKTFDIPELDGISNETIEEHLALYEGYVKHFNLVHRVVEDSNNQDFVRREVYRRQAFEYDGIKNHELYFAQFEGGAKALSEDSSLYQKMSEGGMTYDIWVKIFRNLATTRGVGWAILGYNEEDATLIQYWVDEQHLGHLTSVKPILVLDMWEHSYMLDHPPSEKEKYVDAFFQNLNWEVVNSRI